MASFALENQKGQSLLIVVLVMIIALTVGLALISRTLTSVKTSTEEASSQKALGAAEAGIEQSLKSNTPINQTSFGSDSKFETSISPVSGRSFMVNGGNVVQRDDDVDVWMSDYSTESAKLYLNPISSNVSVSFGTATNACDNPAIEIDVISGSKTAPIQNSYAYDPCVSRRAANRFSAPEAGSGDNFTDPSGNTISFSHKTPTISVTNGLFMRIVPIYKSSKIGVSSSNSLPSQGSIVNSIGTSGTTKRSIVVFQGFPKIPAEFFPYSLFSPQ